MDDETKRLANDAFLNELDEIRTLKIGGANGQPGLQQAFPYWFVQKFLRIEDHNDIMEIIAIGGPGDLGCDFFVIMNDDGSIHSDDDNFSEEEKVIIWGQCKLADDMNNEIFDTAQLEKTVAVEEHLKDTEGELKRLEANQAFLNASKIFKEMTIRTSGTSWKGRIKMVVAVAGKIQPQTNLLLEPGSAWRLRKFEGVPDQKKEIEKFEIDEILTRMMLPRTPDVHVKFVEEPFEKFDSYEMNPNTYRQPDHANNHSENKGECDCSPKGNRSLVGHISAKNLIELHTGSKGVGDTIFLENPRSFLGAQKSTYKSMLETLEKKEKPNGKLRFWKFNNGITATCDEIINEADSELTCGECRRVTSSGRYLIKNMKIVNGQQTTTTLSENRSEIDDDGIQVGLRIHVTTDIDERKTISKSTNRQNALSGEELMDIGNEHGLLKLQCETDYPRYYYERQKEGFKVEPTELKIRVTSRRNLVKASTAISFYAYNVDPQRATYLGRGKIFTEDKPHDYKLVYFNNPATIPEGLGTDGKVVQEQKYGPAIQQAPEINITPSAGLAGNIAPEGYRNVRELIIAHIFRSLLENIKLKWSKLSKDYDKWVIEGSDPSKIDAITRDLYWMASPTNTPTSSVHKRFSSIAGKGHVQYFVLNWINESLKRFTDTEKYAIEEAIIEQFGNIRLIKDPIPDELLRIAKVAWRVFLRDYDWNRQEQWFGLLNPPSPNDTLTHLKNTPGIVTTLRGYNEELMNQSLGEFGGQHTGDPLMEELKSYLPEAAGGAPANVP